MPNERSTFLAKESKLITKRTRFYSSAHINAMSENQSQIETPSSVEVDSADDLSSFESTFDQHDPVPQTMSEKRSRSASVEEDDLSSFESAFDQHEPPSPAPAAPKKRRASTAASSSPSPPPSITQEVGRFAVALIGSDAWVVEPNYRNPDTNDIEMRLMKPSAFKKFWSHQFDSMADVDNWVKTFPHYQAVVFKPCVQTPPDILNIWRGFAYPLVDHLTREDCETICEPFFRHIAEVWCSNDAAKLDYVKKWLAHIVQKPNEPVGTALVLRGVEGSGKGTIVTTMGSLLGPHFKHLTMQHELTGQFNAWMADALLVFADETTWGGDVKGEGIIKALITEPTTRSMRKFCEAEKHVNRMHLIFSSNNSWVVPAGPSARRFVPLDTDAKYAGCSDYWSRLTAHLGSDEFRTALLNYLDKYVDLTGFVASQIPAQCASALLDLKLRSLNPVARWLQECLADGCFDIHLCLNDTNVQLFDKKAVHEAYLSWCQKHSISSHQRTTSELMFSELRTIFAGRLTETRPGSSSSHRPRLVGFPPIAEARRLFAEHLKTPVELVFPDDIN